MGYYCTDEAAAGPRGETCETGTVLTGFESVGSGYRFYSSELGRWINRDPIGEEGGRNLFVANHNNCTIWIDPKGLTPSNWRQQYPYNVGIGRVTRVFWSGIENNGAHCGTYKDESAGIYDDRGTADGYRRHYSHERFAGQVPHVGARGKIVELLVSLMQIDNNSCYASRIGTDVRLRRRGEWTYEWRVCIDLFKLQRYCCDTRPATFKETIVPPTRGEECRFFVQVGDHLEDRQDSED